MNARAITAILVITLMVVPCSLAASVSDASGGSGTASGDGITVSYVDAASPVVIDGSLREVGIMTIAFSSDPNDGPLVVVVDGKKSAAMSLGQDLRMQFLVDRLEAGNHSVIVNGDTRSWGVTLPVGVAVTSIQLSSTSLSMTVGDKTALTATVLPSDATDKRVSWSSQKTSVATVDKDGGIKAVSAGTTVITAACGSVTATCKVTVSDPYVPPTPPTPPTPTHTHSWDDGKVTKQATCTEDGVKTYTCTICGETRTESIPASGHAWSDWVLVEAATVEEDGIKSRTCQNCGEEEFQPIPKIIVEYNDDHSTTVTETELDGSIVKTTEGGDDGSKTVEKIKETVEDDGSKVSTSEKTRTESDGSVVQIDKSSTTSSDGSVRSADVTISATDEGTGTVTKATSTTDSSGKTVTESVTTITASTEVIGTQSKVEVTDAAVAAALNQIAIVNDNVDDARPLVVIESETSRTVSSAEVTISAESIRDISEVSGASVSVTTSVGTMVLDQATVSNLGGKGDVSIVIDCDVEDSLTDAQKKIVGDDPVYDLSLFASQDEVHELGGTVIVSVPFDATGANIDNLNAWYLNGDDLELVGKATYRDGFAEFSVTHFSLYVIKDDSPDVDPGTGSNNTLLYVGIGAAAVLAIIALLVVVKRRTR